ncbi:unnamed protein product [Amoebophrya sp. A120]|nr:unnamed protein product [Amoebophrya sp. A120]|eukprot:GSA120T00013019001.1
MPVLITPESQSLDYICLLFIRLNFAVYYYFTINNFVVYLCTANEICIGMPRILGIQSELKLVTFIVIEG